MVDLEVESFLCCCTEEGVYVRRGWSHYYMHGAAPITQYMAASTLSTRWVSRSTSKGSTYWRHQECAFNNNSISWPTSSATNYKHNQWVWLVYECNNDVNVYNIHSHFMLLNTSPSHASPLQYHHTAYCANQCVYMVNCYSAQTPQRLSTEPALQISLQGEHQ